MLVFNLIKGNEPRESLLLSPILIGFNNFLDVRWQQRVLALARLIELGRVDEQDIVRALTLLENQNANGDPSGIEELGRQADNSVDVSVLQQLCAYRLLGSAAEKNAMREYDRHGSISSVGLQR